MANCHNYADTIKGHEGVSHINDDELLNVVKNHMKPEFWQPYTRADSDRTAYVRRWAMTCRREARRRGLL